MAPPVEAADGACDYLTGLAQFMCEVGVGDGVDSPITDPGGWLQDVTIGNVARASAEAAETMILAMWSLIMETTAVDLTADWVRGNVVTVMLIALPIVVLLFMVQLTVAAFRRQPVELVRAVVGMVAAFGASAVALSVAHTTLVITDWACDLIMRWRAGVQVGEALDALTPAILVTAANGSGVALPAFLIIIFACLFIAGSFCVWFALMARKGLIIIAAVFAPLAFAGLTSRFTSSWATRWLSIMFALALSKIAVVMVFAIATGAINAGLSGESDSTLRGIGELSLGLMMLALAAIAPWLTYKFIDFVSPSGRDWDGTFGHAGATARAGSHSARSVMTRTRTAMTANRGQARGSRPPTRTTGDRPSGGAAGQVLHRHRPQQQLQMENTKKEAAQ